MYLFFFLYILTNLLLLLTQCYHDGAYFFPDVNSYEAYSSTAIVSVIFNILRIFNTVTIDTHCQLQSKLKEETQQSAYLCQIVVTGEQQMH